MEFGSSDPLISTVGSQGIAALKPVSSRIAHEFKLKFDRTERKVIVEILIHLCGQELNVFYPAVQGMIPEYVLDDPSHPIQHCPKCGLELKYEDFMTQDNLLPAMNRPIYAQFSTRPH